MKVDTYAEMYLWNLGIDRLLRVLQRLQAFSLCSKQAMKAYEVRLEEIRAGLNADFADAMATRERADEGRLWNQRRSWEGSHTEGRLR